jgi:hypothetical protein
MMNPELSKLHEEMKEYVKKRKLDKFTTMPSISSSTTANDSGESPTGKEVFASVKALYGLKVVQDSPFQYMNPSVYQEEPSTQHEKAHVAFKTTHFVNRCPCGGTVEMKRCVLVNEGANLVDTVVDIYTRDVIKMYIAICACGNVFYMDKK